MRYDDRAGARYDMRAGMEEQHRFDQRYRQQKSPTIFYVFAFTMIGGLFYSEMMAQTEENMNQHMRRRTDTVVLVTGGTGTIGRAVHREITKSRHRHKERWIFVGSRDGDLREDFETRRLFYRHHPTHVLHLAALSTTVKDGDFPVDSFRDNILMNDNIMECAKEQGVKVVSVMSSDVFPMQSSTQALNESMVHSGAPHYLHEGYAYAKRMQELMNRAYRKQYSTHFTSVIPADTYGPDDNFKVDHEHIIASLIHKTHLAKQMGEPLKVQASADTVRQFVHLEDLAKLLIWSVFKYDEPTPVILAPSVDDAVTLKELVKMVADEMDFKGETVFEGVDSGLGAKGQGVHRVLSNDKLRGLYKDESLGFKPLKEGIKEAVGWFKKNSGRIPPPPKHQSK